MSQDKVTESSTRSGHTHIFPIQHLKWIFLIGLIFLAGLSCGKEARPPKLAPITASPKDPETKRTNSPIVPAPELKVHIEPPVVQKGESALLVWETRHVDEVRFDQNIGIVDTAGKIKFYPEETTSYRVSVHGPGGKLEKSVTVHVSETLESSISQKDLLQMPWKEQFQQAVQPIFFSFDSFQLNAPSKLILNENIVWLSRPENIQIQFVLEGHCDARGTDEYNLALADKRAQITRQYLVAAGINPHRISTVSFGEEKPFYEENTEKSWALNRRVHFSLVQDQK